MKYVILKTKQKVLIKNEDLKAIDDAMCDDDISHVRINGLLYSVSAISHFEDATGVTDPNAPSSTLGIRLNTGNICRGQFSIQLEVIGIACRLKKLRLLNDPKWTNEQLKELRKTGKVWCDHRKNKCACEPNYQPVGGRVPAFVR